MSAELPVTAADAAELHRAERYLLGLELFGMRFGLDLVWLDRHDDVLEIAAAVAPRRQRTNWRARSVIEVASGRGQDFADAWAHRRLASPTGLP